MRSLELDRIDRVAASILFGVAFVVLSGVMIILNTTLLRMGDEKFGSSGWQFYWPIWDLFFLPVVISAAFVAAFAEVPRRTFRRLLGLFLVMILAALELSFILDIKWQVVLGEWVALTTLFIVVARRARGSPPISTSEP